MKNFHACVKAFVSNEKQSDWDVKSLFDNVDAKQTSELCANFFNGISSEYRPLKPDQIPKGHDCPLPTITPRDVEEAVKTGKNKASTVPGDLYCDILKDCLPTMSNVIARIFNKIVTSKQWPAEWKKEHVTIIPKKPRPEDLGQCRNISCTNHLSKVLERIVLGWARQQVGTKNNQFGGEQGCSTNHLLVDMYDTITENLEDSRATSITSIDYSKAFNRLDHAKCLHSFQKKGASTQMLALLGSFLMGRTMSVRVDQETSYPRDVNAGAPQGSVLGTTFMFNIGTDELEEEFDYTQEDPGRFELNEGDLTFMESQHTETYAESTPERIRLPDYFDISPIGQDRRVVEFLPTV